MKKILPALLFILIAISYSFAQSAGGNRDGKLLGFSDLRDQNKPAIKIDVFPNPAIDNVFVRLESSEHPKVEFEMYNIIGSTLKVESEEIERNYYKIGIKELPAGYYLLMVKDPVAHITQAFKIHKANK